MSYIEKYRFTILAALSVLTVAAFLGLKGVPPAPSALSDLQETAPATDEITSSNCGKCTSQTGAQVDCDKLTQKYTCASKATACASFCQ